MNKQVGKNKARPFYYYRCGYHYRRGNTVCANGTGLRQDRIEGAILDLFKKEILTKQNVQDLVEDVQKAWKKQEQEDPNKDLKRIERDLKKRLTANWRTWFRRLKQRASLRRCEMNWNAAKNARLPWSMLARNSSRNSPRRPHCRLSR